MSDKFRPIKTTKVTCKECGHEGMLEVDELSLTTSTVNYVAKIRKDEREKMESQLQQEQARSERYSTAIEKAVMRLGGPTMSYAPDIELCEVKESNEEAVRVLLNALHPPSEGGGKS